MQENVLDANITDQVYNSENYKIMSMKFWP